MISARTLQVKKLGEDMGIDDKEMSKAQKALTQLGISIKDQGTGSLRSLDDVLKDVAGKWDGMTDAQRQYTSEALAGTRQRAIFMDLMKSMTTQQSLYNNALQSEGALDEANSKKAESIQGKLNILKNTVNQKWSNFIDSDTVKGAIDAVTKLIDTFGSLSGVLGLATTAFLVFKGKALTSLISDMIAVTAGETAMSVATVGLSGVFTTLSEVLLDNPFGVVAVAITGLIGVFSLLNSNADNTKEKLENFKSSAEGLSKINTQESLIEQYKSLQSTINDSKTPTDKLTEANQKLLEVKKQLAQQMPELVDGYDKENTALVSNIDAVEKKVNEDKKNVLKDAEDNYQKAYLQLTAKKEYTTPADVENGINQVTTELPSQVEEYKKLAESTTKLTDTEKKRRDELKETFTEMNKNVLLMKQNGGDISGKKLFNFDTNDFENATQRIKELEQASKEASNSKNNATFELIPEEKISIISSALKELNGTSNLSENAVKRLAQALPNLDLSNMSATEKVDALTKALKDQNDELNKNAIDSAKQGQKDFMEQETGIEKINKYLEEMQKNGQMSADIMKELATSDLFSDFTGDLTNMASVQDYFNSKVENMRSIQNKAYQEMNGNSQSFYKNQMHNGNALQSAYETWASNYVNVNETGYRYDSNNYNTLNQAKNGMLSNMSTVMSSYLSNLVGGSAEAYKKDLEGCKDWGEMKTRVLQKLDEKLANLNANFATGSSIMAEITKLETIGLNDPMQEALLNKTKQLQADIQANIQNLMNNRKKIEADFNNINLNDGQWNPPAKPVDPYKPIDYKGENKDAQKNISYITDETDALLDLKNAVEKVNKAIEQNQALAENEEGQKKIDLMKQQIDLYNQLRTAQGNLKNGEINQMNSLKQNLIAQGFSFNGDDLVGSQNRLEQLKNSFNSQMTSDTDNVLKSQYDQIKKWVDSYEKLVRDEIPNVTKDILDINNKIIASQKEIAEELEKVRDKFIKDEEAKTETVKKELEKQRKIKEDEKNKEDKQDELGEKQKSLNDLQMKYSEALKTNDSELIKEARKNIEDSQRELNKYLKDQNYQDTVDRISNEETYVEDESKSKIDNINKQLSDDNILKLVQQGVTNIDDMLKNVKTSTEDLTTPIYNIGDIINNNWLSATEKMKNNLLESASIIRSSLVGNIGIDSNMTVTAKDTKPVAFNIKQEINVQGDMTKDSLPEIQNALDDFKDEFEKFRDNVKDAVHV